MHPSNTDDARQRRKRPGMHGMCELTAGTAVHAESTGGLLHVTGRTAADHCLHGMASVSNMCYQPELASVTMTVLRAMLMSYGHVLCIIRF